MFVCRDLVITLLAIADDVIKQRLFLLQSDSRPRPPISAGCGFLFPRTNLCKRTERDLYRVPEIVTRGRFPDGGESDSTWRTQEARHVGSDTIAPGF